MTVWFDKRRRRWRYDIRVAGRRYAGLCVDAETGVGARNVTEARRCEATMRAKAIAEIGVARAASAAYTLAEAAADYAKVSAHQASWFATKRYIAELLAFFDPSTPVEAITSDRIEAYRSWQLQQPRLVWVKTPGPAKFRALGRPAGTLKPGKGPRSAQTANHYLKALRAILRRATRSIDPETRRPRLAVAPIVALASVPKRLPRPLTEGEITTVHGELAPHVADALELCLQFGLRKREALTLEVADVDLAEGGIRLRGERTKGRRDAFLPASKAGMALLERLVAQAKREGQTHLVLYRGPQGTQPPRPVKNIGGGWRAALRRAGLERARRFHDSRAAYVTALARSAPAPVVQELARHRDFETTLRYIRFADSAKRDAVAKLPDWTAAARSSKQNFQTPPQEEGVIPPNALKGMACPAGFEPTTSSSGG